MKSLNECINNFIYELENNVIINLIPNENIMNLFKKEIASITNFFNNIINSI